MLRLRGRLDYRLSRQVRRPLASLDADVLDILRLGAYQLEAMDSVPPYAAISQSVELARAAGAPRAAGFVNGVLQGLHRAGATHTFPALEEDPAAHLATWGSHPRWLVERWIRRFGVGTAAAIAEANNRRPELYLRVVGDDAAAVRDRLTARGIETANVDYAPDSLRLANAAELGAALDAERLIVQDPAAALVVAAARPQPGSRVADVCAAPGGKAVGLAAGTPDGAPAMVVAADVAPQRLARLRENIARLEAQDGRRLAPMAIVVADARFTALRNLDLVLIDAPCTGTGTLRRHPDGRWRITPADLEALVRLQAELLEAVAKSVRPGGTIVYSTCSIEAEENEAQVEAFLRKHREFEIEPVVGVDARAVDDAGRLVVLPHTFGVDGAFAARLRRAA
jgi:16S rRNA (cytosine967-C5)-methyltransferase